MLELTAISQPHSAQDIAVVLGNLAVIAAVAAAIVAVLRPFLQFSKLNAEQQQALPRIVVLLIAGGLVALDVYAPTVFQVVAALTATGVGAMGGKHLLSGTPPPAAPPAQP